MPTSGSILGNPVLRKEDPGILEGTTQYYDDLAVAGLLHTAFVRSTVAHAGIGGIDTADAQAMPRVVAVYTAPSWTSGVGMLAGLPFAVRSYRHRNLPLLASTPTTPFCRNWTYCLTPPVWTTTMEA